MTVRRVRNFINGLRQAQPAATARLQQPRMQQPYVDLRIPGSLLSRVRTHVEDFSTGARAGFLVCRSSRRAAGETLLAIEFVPVPDEGVRSGDEYGLSWSAPFDAQMIERADDADGSLVIVHSHGPWSAVRLSSDNRSKAGELLPSASLVLDGRTCATVVLGDRCIDGLTWTAGEPGAAMRRMTVISDTIEHWAAFTPTRQLFRLRHDRSSRATTESRQGILAQARVAVVESTGRDGRISQQLTHQGIGTVIAIDHELVKTVDLGRLAGTTPPDVGRELQVDVMEPLTAWIDEVRDERVPHRLPPQQTLDDLKSADVIVCCVDSFLVRQQLATFARRHMLPMVDLGMTVKMIDGVLQAAHGQLLVTVPDSPCLRCFNAEAGDWEVVSMSGTLASEACNAVLDLLTAASGGSGGSGGRRAPGCWVFDGGTGAVRPAPLPPSWSACPACAQAGLGDPPARDVSRADRPLVSSGRGWRLRAR
jgi:molybdopterin/thiamine biosynthesis adenylyltransferase